MPPPAAASKATRRPKASATSSGAEGLDPVQGRRHTGPSVSRRGGEGNGATGPGTQPRDLDAARRSSYFFLVVGTVVGVVTAGILITSPVNTWFTLPMLL